MKKNYGFFAQRTLIYAFMLTFILKTSLSLGQSIVNYDESAVRNYSLPNVLLGPNTEQALCRSDWEKNTRPYQLELLEKFVYGCRIPPVEVAVLSEKRTERKYGDTTAVRIQATLQMGTAKNAPTTAYSCTCQNQRKKFLFFLN